MPLAVAVMLPVPDQVVAAYTPVSGWYVGDEAAPIEISFGGVGLVVSQEDRSDLHKLYPGKLCRGFHAVIDIDPNQRPSSAPEVLDVSIEGRPLHRQEIVVDPAAMASAARSRDARASNRAFVLAHLVCSNCGASLAGQAAPARCPACDSRFAQGTRAVSAVAAGTYDIPRTINTSFCHYDDSERQLIDGVAAVGGRVLDFGAGLRPETNATVISLEIADMPSIDIVSVTDRIPFADATFDAAMSLHVLEHVPRPWLTAKEMQRVVKPGGTILSTVPYVCPVHGFPYHFYSMTPQGLRGLFSDAEFVSHVMKADAHPINGLRQLMGTYAGSLPAPLRDAFESLTVRDILSPDLPTVLGQPWAVGLNDAARWEMPAHSTLTVRKPVA